MFKPSEGVEFRIDVTGEETGEQYKGKFKALPRLSARRKLIRDQKRRELLGSQPGQPSEEAVVYASVIAELHVRLVEFPKWWPEAGFGLELEDESPLVEIQKNVERIVGEYQKQVQDAGKAAEAALREKVKAEKPGEDDDAE
jgi:hypothetical protein